MLFSFSNYSSILLIFFFHGLVYSGLLLHRGLKYNDTPSRILSLFIVLCCFYICPWMLGHAGWYTRQPYRDTMFYVPFQQLLFLGPLIYLYTQSLLNQSFRFTRSEWLHFIPGFIYLGYSLVIFITDKWVLGEYYFYLDEKDKDLAIWYQITGLVSMVIYFLLSLRYYYIYKKLAFEVLSFAESVQFKWIKRFLIAFLLMQLARILFLFIYPDWGSFPKKWWYYFIFSLLFYYVSITGYANTIQAFIPFRLSLFDRNPTFLFPGPGHSASQKTPPQAIEVPSEIKAHDELDIAPWKTQITQLIEQEEIYRNPQLSLTDLAQRLGTNPRVISKVINQGFEMNFNDLINFHRVEAVKEQLAQQRDKELTLLGIALECGFNSKTTFNRAFKKHTTLSPNHYLKQIKSKNA